LHAAALACIGRVFGWVSNSEDVFVVLEEAGGKHTEIEGQRSLFAGRGRFDIKY
jgi:hypothetical protein